MVKKVIQNYRRTIPPPLKIKNNVNESPIPNPIPHSSLLAKVQSFIDPKHSCYLGFGGLGDAILLLASCWNDKYGKAVFFANNPTFIHRFFDVFKIHLFINVNVMGHSVANEVYNYMTKLPNFKTSAHLADGLYYGDWANEEKYFSRMVKTVPWRDVLGRESNKKPICIIAPAGSQRVPERQRYLSKNEYEKLVNKYLDSGYAVYATGSSKNLHEYGLVKRVDSYWLHSDNIYKFDGGAEFCDLRKMLKIINAASLVISVDTWVKTYSSLCSIPTKVIKTRWDGVYKDYGTDVSDFIFLNKTLWPAIELVTIESLIS